MFWFRYTRIEGKFSVLPLVFIGVIIWAIVRFLPLIIEFLTFLAYTLMALTVVSVAAIMVTLTRKAITHIRQRQQTPVKVISVEKGPEAIENKPLFKLNNVTIKGRDNVR